MIVFNYKILSRALLCSVILFYVLISASMGHTTVEEAKAAKHSSIKKYHKKLKKQDGAIRLIGGSGDHEGEYFKCELCIELYFVVNWNDDKFYFWIPEKMTKKKNVKYRKVFKLLINMTAII